MAKFKFSRKSKRNPDRLTARDVHPLAYHASSAYASLDDEIDNADRPEGTLPFENATYLATQWD